MKNVPLTSNCTSPRLKRPSNRGMAKILVEAEDHLFNINTDPILQHLTPVHTTLQSAILSSTDHISLHNKKSKWRVKQEGKSLP